MALVILNVIKQQCIKCIKDQQMHLNFTDILLLYCGHQHALATQVAIFRVISLRKRTPLYNYTRIRMKNYYKGMLPPGSMKCVD
jgi:hypothetical protein